MDRILIESNVQNLNIRPLYINILFNSKLFLLLWNDVSFFSQLFFGSNINLLLFLVENFAGKEDITTVAVKTLKENATEIERNDLHSELQVSHTSFIHILCFHLCVTVYQHQYTHFETISLDSILHSFFRWKTTIALLHIFSRGKLQYVPQFRGIGVY